MTDATQMLLKRAFAHRGLHDVTDGRPENSLAAFGAAIDAGYAIELDIQLSRDGQPMVFHDYALSRLTDATGAIRQMDAADLALLPLKGGDETIPSLAQVLEFVAGRTPLLIETKDQDGAMGPDTCGLEEAVARLLKPYQGEMAVMSFNPHSVGNFAKFLPNVPRGLVTCKFSLAGFPTVPAATRKHLRSIPDFDKVGASFISHSVKNLDRDRVLELRQSGVPVLCWTVKSAKAEAKARPMADNITFEGYLPEVQTS